MTKSERATILKAAVPGIAFLIFLVLTFTVLPDNCSLLSNDLGPFHCHTIPLPDYCCTDDTSVNYARLIAIVGIGVTVGLTMHSIRNSDELVANGDK